MLSFSHRVRDGLVRRARRLQGIAGAVSFSMRAGLSKQPSVVYLTEGTGWVIDEIGYQISSHLSDRYLMHMNREHRGYRHTTLHFASTPVYLKRKPFLSVHPSNNIVFTWTHGLPDNPDPNIQHHIANLSEGAEYADRIHVWTSTAQDFLIGQGIDHHKIVHIPLGVDTTLFHPPEESERHRVRTQLGIPEEAICIGSFQKDSPGWDNNNREMKWIKGPDVFADVVERLAAHYPIYVLLTSPARGYLISRLEQAGISYRHDVLNKPEHLAPYYHALDLYLITSRDEGGPMAMLEAMASNLPVVSTQMGIPKDAIKHGHNGMLAKVDDVEGLAVSTEQLLCDNELRNQVGDNARKTILAYDWSLIADKYARLLYNFTF